MENRTRVILYGDTLLLAGVRLSLEANLAFEVIPLDALHAAEDGLPSEQELLDLHPDVIIFDTHSVRLQFRYNLIQHCAGLLLIGIDPDRNQVLVWHGQYLHELSVQDLVEVIRKERRGDTGMGRHGDGKMEGRGERQ